MMSLTGIKFINGFISLLAAIANAKAGNYYWMYSCLGIVFTMLYTQEIIDRVRTVYKEMGVNDKSVGATIGFALNILIICCITWPIAWMGVNRKEQ